MREGKGSGKEERAEREKAVAYLRSRIFPWNFIFEQTEEDAIKHFVGYAIQVCEGKGIEKGRVSDGVNEVKALLTTEVREAVNDYLLEADDPEMRKMHGEFAAAYPFAFSQCLVHTILCRLGLELADLVDLRAVSELLGRSVKEMRKNELFVRDQISKNERKAMQIFANFILNRQVLTADGECVGRVSDIIFEAETGDVGGLIVNHQKQKGRGARGARGAGLKVKKTKISMHDVRLNKYSKNIVLNYTSYK